MEEVRPLRQRQGHHRLHQHQALRQAQHQVRILVVAQIHVPALARASLQKDACTSTRKTRVRVVFPHMVATPRQSCHLDVQRDRRLRQDLRQDLPQRRLHHTMILVVVQRHDPARAKRAQKKDVCMSTRKTRVRVVSPRTAATPRRSSLRPALTALVPLWSRCHDLHVSFVSQPRFHGG